ncbi:hypothetical protein FEM48_Zijuj03G0083400 [Ziziphus jujuba var. spinosa]|uniref:Uncharacterized protein n=1 Tax=Ziziphus jujuba var. spinosa TaxID=714518 RepID=A0A978VP77_ZIZJJ|nr:hypothetical protein FEM48_Zijuj03G0083400 [Ziziphus jujuba var. spinosa]
MASSSSSSSSSSSTSSLADSSSSSFFTTATDTVPVTQEQLNIFHSIDRKLFTRLVFNLSRDPAESTQVMALWLWLEQAERDLHFVNKILVNFPDSLLNAIADETVVALNCAESDRFPFPSNNFPDIPLLRSMTNTGSLSLKFFYENRIRVIRGVTRMLNKVCARAFQDILQRVQERKAQEHARLGSLTSVYYSNNHPYNYGGSTVKGSDSSPHVGGGFDTSDLAFQRQIMNSSETGDVLGRLQLGGGSSDVKGRDCVPVDDRTIFLTFSKGYPISEFEVKEFITKKFGDNVIDYIYMQEVSPEDQPLYARLVVRSVSDIGIVLSGKSKAKFSINGKHVWARKFVRKQVKSPQNLSPPSVSQPGSPSEPSQG